MSADTKSPEFESLRVCMYDICSVLSSKPEALTPLSTDLYSVKLIGKVLYDDVKHKVARGGVHPFELATSLVSHVHSGVQFNPPTLYEFADKLAKGGNEEVSLKLLKECESRGGRKAPPTMQQEADSEEDQRLLQQVPTLRLFQKHVGFNLQNEWKELGGLLGVPLLRLNTIEGSQKRPINAIMDVFEGWEQTDEVEFTWSSLFNQLNNSTINRDTVSTIKRSLIKDLQSVSA